ncbi:MAG: uroporphyrinogen decarboxylase family protein [Candidatus Brocadiaceae bacterium]|jgi:uroporphyrinogen decarboxylase
MYAEKENFLRVLRRDDPSHVCHPPPSKGASYVGAWPAHSRPSPEATSWRDEWGVLWEVRDGEVFPVGPAVPSCEQVDELEPPDPRAPGRMEPLEQVARTLDRSRYFLSSVHPYFLYEKAINILGPAEFGVCMLAEPDAAHRLLDAILEFELGIAEQYLDRGVEGVTFSDDYGHQDRLAMSPECWRTFIKPRLARAIAFYRDRLGPDAPIGLHSCGHVMPILEDLMEIGLDILHPVQSTANDLAEVRVITTGHMTLAGGIDGQRILPLGTPDDVREEVYRKMDLLWENGGYLPMAEKKHGVPPENVEATERAIRDWSRLNVEA